MLKKIPLLFIVFFSCQTKIIQPDDINFARWFLNPNNRLKNKSALPHVSEKKIDSFVINAKKKYGIGNFTEKLYDEDRTEYTLGFSTPQNIFPDSLYPLVIYLHGGIGRAQNDKGKNAYEMFRFLADTIDIFLASPTATKSTPWWSAPGLNRILRTIRFMSLYFPINPDRIFLAGVSDGALGCYAAANTINGPFAGFIAISGFGGLLPQVGLELYPINLRQRPIYNINGGNDHLYSLKYINQFIDWLIHHGIPVENKIYPRGKHGFDYRQRETSRLTEIIKTWYRPQRSGIAWNITPGYPNCADNLLTWTIKKDQPGVSPQIHTYWHHDTLNIKINGINSFYYIANQRPTNKLFYKYNNGKVRSLNSEYPNKNQILKLMMHYHYPALWQKQVFHFKSN